MLLLLRAQCLMAMVVGVSHAVSLSLTRAPRGTSGESHAKRAKLGTHKRSQKALSGSTHENVALNVATPSPTSYGELEAFWEGLDYLVTMSFADDDTSAGSTGTALNVLVDTSSSNFGVSHADCTSCLDGVDSWSPSLTVDPIGTQTLNWGGGYWTGSRTSVGVEFAGVSTVLTVSAITAQENLFGISDTSHGVLGLGYESSATIAYTETSGATLAYTPFLNQLDSAGVFDALFYIQICEANPLIGFGAVDMSLAEDGIVTYVDVQQYADSTTGVTEYRNYMLYPSSIAVGGITLSTVTAAELAGNQGGVDLDIGVTMSYFPPTVLYAIVEGITNHVVDTGDAEFLISIASGGFFRQTDAISNTTNLPDNVTISFSNGFDLVLEQKNYLVRTISGYVFALAASDSTIIGDIGLRGQLLVFDQTNNKIGFGTATCDTFAPSSTPAPSTAKPTGGKPTNRPTSSKNPTLQPTVSSSPTYTKKPTSGTTPSPVAAFKSSQSSSATSNLSLLDQSTTTTSFEAKNKNPLLNAATLAGGLTGFVAAGFALSSLARRRRRGNNNLHGNLYVDVA